jgi:hypothetical protein
VTRLEGLLAWEQREKRQRHRALSGGAAPLPRQAAAAGGAADAAEAVRATLAEQDDKATRLTAFALGFGASAAAATRTRGTRRLASAGGGAGGGGGDGGDGAAGLVGAGLALTADVERRPVKVLVFSEFRQSLNIIGHHLLQVRQTILDDASTTL